MQQQTKQAAQQCAGGAAYRRGDVARQAGAVTKPGTGSSPTIPGLPPGGFATILVDPPWPLQSGEKHYRTMSLARIMALPVGSLAARDAHLWLWTTNALLPRVSLLVWWQFLRRSLAGGSGLEQEGASWGSGFSTKIHQEVVPRCPVTSLPCPR